MGFGEHGVANRLDDVLDTVFGVGGAVTFLAKARKLSEQLFYLRRKLCGVHLLGSQLAGKEGGSLWRIYLSCREGCSALPVGSAGLNMLPQQKSSLLLNTIF